MNGSEIIRDFDGWSWNVQENEIEDVTNNFLYQTLIVLVGNTFLNAWQNSSSEDYMTKLLEELERKYKTEKAEKILMAIKQISILNYVKKDEKELKRLIDIQESLELEYKRITNKKEYLKDISEEKKEINKKICSIDAIISNDKLLKQEFIIRNENLSSNERIFSLSDFVELLQNEKAEWMKKLNNCNKKMEPLNFVKLKVDIEDRLKTLKELNLTEDMSEIYDIKIKELIKLVCDAIGMQADTCIEKDEINDIIYKIRYYKSIPVYKNEKVSDMVDFSKLENYVITIACKMKVLNIISKNIKENYEIIKNIFQTDIIKLDKIQIKFIEKDEKILLEIYEEENKNTTIEFDKIEELILVKNKKVKLFV